MIAALSESLAPMSTDTDRFLKAPSAAELFIPKLVTVLREGYRFADLRADVIAGLTVAIVALPLSDGHRHRLGRGARTRAVHRRNRRPS